MFFLIFSWAKQIKNRRTVQGMQKLEKKVRKMSILFGPKKANNPQVLGH